jgi:hypothetical protein
VGVVKEHRKFSVNHRECFFSRQCKASNKNVELDTFCCFLAVLVDQNLVETRHKYIKGLNTNTNIN